MMIKSTIKSTIKLLSYDKCVNYITLSLFDYNENLLNDNEFIKSMFEIYCKSSNIDMVHYIYTNCDFLNNNEQNTIYLNNIFLSMCESSSIEIIKWYYNQFHQVINLKEDKYLLKALENLDLSVFKYLLDEGKNIYTKTQYKKIFLHCVKNFSTNLAKLIYHEYPEIDLIIVNGVKIYNSIDIYSPKTMISWLKEIGEEQNYSVEINLYNKLEINKIFLVLPFEKYTSIVSINTNDLTKLNYQECVICFTNKTDIITNCGHQFCIECIRNWINKDYTCPNCRNSHPKIKFYHMPKINIMK